MSVDSNFSDLYRADPTQAQKLLDHPDVEIIQKTVQTPSLFGTRTTVTRHLCLGGQDYGPIDELSSKILKKTEKTAEDVSIAHKLSTLYEACESQQSSTLSKTQLVQLQFFSRGLKEVSGDFSQIYRNDPSKAQKLLRSATLEIVEQSVEIASWGKTVVTTVRHIRINGDDYGPIDDLANHILGKEKQSIPDMEIALKLSELYKGVDDSLSEQLQAVEYTEHFSDIYARNSSKALAFLNEKSAKIVEQPVDGESKTIRCIYVEGVNFGPIDEVSNQILRKKGKHVQDVQLAQRLSALYQKLDDQSSGNEEMALSSAQRNQGRQLYMQLQQMVGDFSEIHKTDPTEALKLLNSENVEILETNNRSLMGRITTTRSLYIDGVNLGPVDGLVVQILEKKNKTSLEVEIAHKLSELYEKLDQSLDGQESSDLVDTQRAQRQLICAQLQVVVEEEFSEIFKEKSDRAKKLLDSRNVEFIEVNSKRGDIVTRCICVDGKNYGPIDGLTHQILAKRRKTAKDLECAHKLSVLYQILDKTFDHVEQTETTRNLKAQRVQFATQLQRAVYYDFINTLRSKREKTIERFEGHHARDKCEEISEMTSRRDINENPIYETLNLPILDVYGNPKQIPVRIEYKDFIKRFLRDQVLVMLEKTEGVSQEILASEDFKIVKEAKEKLDDVGYLEEVEAEVFYNALSQIFLADLSQKLGPDTKLFILEISMFLEQVYPNYLAMKLKEHLPDPDYIPNIMNPETIITIYPDRVNLEIRLDCSATYKGEMGEELPFGIRAKVNVSLEKPPKHTSFSIVMEKLENGPTFKESSPLYPIIVAFPSSESGNTTPLSESSFSRSSTPESLKSGSNTSTDGSPTPPSGGEDDS